MNQKENEYRDCYRADQNIIPKLQDLHNGYQITKCLHAAAKLNVSHVIGASLDNKKEISEIARIVGADCNALLILMRALVANGIYKECGDGIFQNNEISLSMADPYIRDETIMIGDTSFYRGWENLYDTVVSGKSQIGKALNSKDYWDFCHKYPEQEVIFSKGMTSLSMRTTPLLVKQGDYNQFETICDLGGSQGIFLFEILKNCPNVKKGINFDQPSVIKNLEGENGRPWLKDERFCDYPGSFFDSVPPADCYIMKCIIHNWENQKAKEILRTIAKSIKPGGKIHILDYILDDGIKDNESYVRLLDLHMLQTCNSQERSKKEFEDLVSDTPFKIEKIILSTALHCQHTIILSLK